MVIRAQGKKYSGEKTQKITLPEMYVEQAHRHLELERAWNTLVR